jgi:hypothetical protein
MLGGCRASVRRGTRAATRVREPEQGWWDAQEEFAGAAGGAATVTVAAVHDWDAGRDADAVATRLADLAVDDELLVVFGAEGPGRPAHRAMVAGLRRRLPRHDVVALAARPELGHLLARLLDAGSLPVVLTEAGGMHDLTAQLASLVRADRVVRVFRTATGADLYPVWRRPGTMQPALN